jgi:superfamily II DNA or RNA helicase
MELDVYNTHIELYPYTKDDCVWLERQFEAIDKFTQNKFPIAYAIEDNKLFLPRGAPIHKIEHLMNVQANYIKESDPFEKMSRQYSSYYDARDKLQEDSIEFLINTPNLQLALNLATGAGKSFVVAYASTQLNTKTIIITHNTGIKRQWINTYSKMFNYKREKLLDVSGSNIMEALMNDMIEPADVYFVNHQTLRSYMTQYNGYALHKFFKKIKTGIKVYDEAHLEFANIILVDFYSNTDKNIYLTATFDRSDKTESACFKRAFSSVIAFGEFESKEAVEKHVVYHVVNINSRATPRQKARIIGFSGMSGVSYAHYAFKEDVNQTAYRTILAILEKTKSLEGKTLLFVPLIDVADDIVRRLKTDFPEKTVSAYHSKIDKDEKESALKKDIIVSTIKSCGTGRDIPGLRVIVCLEPIASKVVAEQMIGRLRPYEDKLTYFFDVCDVCIPPINYWHIARFKKIQTLVKEVVYLNMD